MSYQLVNKVIKVTHLQEILDNKLDDIHQNSLKTSITVDIFTQNQLSDIIDEPPWSYKHLIAFFNWWPFPHSSKFLLVLWTVGKKKKKGTLRYLQSHPLTAPATPLESSPNILSGLLMALTSPKGCSLTFALISPVLSFLRSLFKT